MPKRYRRGGKRRPSRVVGRASLLKWIEFMGGTEALERMKKWPGQKQRNKDEPEPPSSKP